jgi:hypothetical protein
MRRTTSRSTVVSKPTSSRLEPSRIVPDGVDSTTADTCASLVSAVSVST